MRVGLSFALLGLAAPAAAAAASTWPAAAPLTLSAAAAPTLSAAAPLTLYDTAREATPIAPLAPVTACGGFAVACSAAPVSPRRVLPFDYGLSVSGTVVGSSRGAFGGVGVSGWVKPRDIPLTLYFDVERLQALSRRR